MNPNGPRRGPIVWLLPLIVGVVLGGLFFGGSHRGDRFDGPPWRHAESAPVPVQPVQPAQPAQPAQPPAAPQAPDPRFEGRGEHFRGFDQRGGFVRHDHDWGFFPFGGMRLLLPLLLMGAGAWLLFGRRGPRHQHSGPAGWGGPGHWGGPGPHPAQQYGPGPYPAQPGPGPQPAQQAAPPPPAGPYTTPPSPPTPPNPNDPPSTGETRIL
ncbi:MAG TPA: hypothetical protein VGD69_09205 [Herpetosiphonaceae bacterium]